jgi:hypothetical protein
MKKLFSVPLHDELKKGTLNGNLKQAGLDIGDLEK